MQGGMQLLHSAMQTRFALIRELSSELGRGSVLMIWPLWLSQDAGSNAAAALSYAGKIYPHQRIDMGMGGVELYILDLVIVGAPGCREECSCCSQLCRQDFPSSEYLHGSGEGIVLFCSGYGRCLKTSWIDNSITFLFG
jgi:hypothetical protein